MITLILGKAPNLDSCEEEAGVSPEPTGFQLPLAQKNSHAKDALLGGAILNPCCPPPRSVQWLSYVSFRGQQYTFKEEDPKKVEDLCDKEFHKQEKVGKNLSVLVL